MALFSMGVVLTAWLITYYISKLILVVLFYLLAHPGCHTRTAVVPSILYGHRVVLKAIWQSLISFTFSTEQEVLLPHGRAPCGRAKGRMLFQSPFCHGGVGLEAEEDPF